MRKIRSSIVPKIKSQVKEPRTSQATRITFALNANLCQQAENILKSRWSQNDYTYKSLSELIRKSLTAYREGKINVNPTERDKHAPKREITVRFGLVPDLLNFYYSLPYSQRTAIIEGSLREYLEKLNEKELEKYRKIIEPKPKPKLSPYFNINFTCDNCGDEYVGDVVYSYARSLKELDKHHTYCSNCVVVE